MGRDRRLVACRWEESGVTFEDAKLPIYPHKTCTPNWLKMVFTPARTLNRNPGWESGRRFKFSIDGSNIEKRAARSGGGRI